MNFTLKKSDLNFKVYTVEAKPTTPGAENDIAIISSVPMTNWLMSPEKPSGIPRNDGDVWIQYSTSGNTFNALKQNALMIATISAWQYVDGAWVDREAVSCQGGKWADFIYYLYNSGDECVDITGGWYINRNMNATLTKNADNMVLNSGSLQSSSSITMQKGTDIDFSNHSIIHVTFEAFESGHRYHNVTLSFRTGVNHDTSTIISEVIHQDLFAEETTLSLPIPSNAAMAFCIYVYAGAAVIKNVRLE